MPGSLTSEEMRVWEDIILPRLPAGAVLHVKAGDDAMLSGYLRQIVERRSGRIEIVVD